MSIGTPRALLVALVLLERPALGAGDTIDSVAGIVDVQQLSLEDLLNAPVEVASRKPQTSREASGIVTVITREEILAMGARDLIDVLYQVPGFGFGVDVTGIVGVGFRGHWGHEGKILMLVDGQEMNERLYSTLQLGNHVPVEHIQRIEIIRGPGSAVYGGYAELAVINIITRDGKDLDGVAASSYYGQMAGGFGGRSLSASYGQEVRRVPGLSFSLSGYLGQRQRSDGIYRDFAGAEAPMLDNSNLDSLFLNVGLQYRALRLRFLYDDYHAATRDGSSAVLPQTADQRFQSLFLDLRYDAQLSERITLTPRLSFKRQTAWQVTDHSSPLFYDKSAHRLLGGLTLSYDILKGLHLLTGVEAFLDNAVVNDETLAGFQTLFGGDTQVNYGNVAGFAQVIFNNFIANVTAGARYEYNSQFGSSFVPRVGLTKVAGRFHFKLLYSQAFRAPGIENVNLGTDLHPERTHVAEAEVGCMMTDHMFLSLNGYYIRIVDPIVYTTDAASGSEGYLNDQVSSTFGLEAEYRLRYGWGYATLHYSYYSAAWQERVAAYAVPGDDTVLLAFPGHKLGLHASFNLYHDIVALNLSPLLLSRRYGYVGADETGAPVIGSDGPTVLLSFSVTLRHPQLKGVDLALGVHNLLDQELRFLQPYNGGHAPLPGASRELFLRLSFSRNLGG